MGWRSGEADRTEWRGEEKALWRGYQAERVKTWVRDPFRVQHRILGATVQSGLSSSSVLGQCDQGMMCRSPVKFQPTPWPQKKNQNETGMAPLDW
jgi:hypothetical protein